MKEKEFYIDMAKHGFNVFSSDNFSLEAPTACGVNVWDNYVIAKRVKDQGSSIEDEYNIIASISKISTGCYSIFNPVSNHVAKSIRKFANTDVHERTAQVVAVIGLDCIPNEDGEAVYSAYDGNGTVLNDLDIDSLKKFKAVHLDAKNKSDLENMLELAGMPKPKFVPVDEIDNRLVA